MTAARTYSPGGGRTESQGTTALSSVAAGSGGVGSSDAGELCDGSSGKVGRPGSAARYGLVRGESV